MAQKLVDERLDSLDIGHNLGLQSGGKVWMVC